MIRDQKDQDEVRPGGSAVGAPEWSEVERSETSRNGGAPTAPPKTPRGDSDELKKHADPEVSGKAVRRRFSTSYKLKVLRETDACSRKGELGAYLRREGLYSSLLTEWRRLRKKGVLEALKPKSRGPKPTGADSPLAQENRCLRAEVGQLQARLRQAEGIIEIQKKVSEILGVPLKPSENGGDA